MDEYEDYLKESISEDLDYFSDNPVYDLDEIDEVDDLSIIEDALDHSLVDSPEGDDVYFDY